MPYLGDPNELIRVIIERRKAEAEASLAAAIRERQILIAEGRPRATLPPLPVARPQHDLAFLLGVLQQAVSGWLLGKSRPELSNEGWSALVKEAHRVGGAALLGHTR